MLVEIHCDQFRVSPIRFHGSLNVVLGDENGTNSIGKSTLLMVVDFAFGGSHLVEYNRDLVPELGHHDYYFVFEFGDTVLRYRRGTFEPDIVYLCDEKFEPEAAIELYEYNGFLKQAYEIDLPAITWRDLVGPYLRIWGKDNLSVREPLHVVQKEAGKKAVDRLIKAFGRYESIGTLATDLARQEGRLEALTKAVRRDVLPKIGSKDYTKNTLSIAAVQQELDNIRHDLAKYATNISDLVSQDVLDLKRERDRLANIRIDIVSRLRRTQANITENRHISSRHFHGLVELVPEVDAERLAEIEEFHSGLARALRTELKESERDLSSQLASVDDAIRDIDSQMAATLKSIKEPSQLVDKVVALASELQRARRENDQYVDEETLRTSVNASKEELSALRRRILAEIEDHINDGMRSVVSQALGVERKSPELTLFDTGYQFEVFEDTGTGTAYTGVIVLDQTILRATQLPVVAHDTIMFKNVENDSVARLLDVYTATDKQSFIAIDEIGKYGASAAAQLRSLAVVALDEQNVLYNKSWRRETLSVDNGGDGNVS